MGKKLVGIHGIKVGIPPDTVEQVTAENPIKCLSLLIVWGHPVDNQE
jgi:hypothetical protein